MNRFAICDGYYMFASLYHGGQGSKEYAYFGRLNKIGYKPGPDASSQNPERLEEESKEVYDRLVDRYESRQEKSIETDAFDAPAIWASALINGDMTGLDYYGAECVAEFEQWFKEHEYNVIDCSSEPHIGRWNGLQTELLTYTRYV